MRKLIIAAVALALSAVPALADFTGKDAIGSTVTFKNAGTCTSVVCVPQTALTDSTGVNFAAFPTAGADAQSNTATGILNYSRMVIYNGATWDRWSGAVTITGTLPSFASTQTVNLGTIGTAATAANQTSGGQKTQITDGSGNAAVIQSTTPSSGDKAVTVIIHPNSSGLVPLGSATPANSIPTVSAGFTYANINTATTTTVKSGAGVLHSVCVNTINATSTAQMYDNTAGSGTKIGLITQATGQQPSCLVYDVAFGTGLTIVTTTGTPDYTVSYR